MWDAILAYLAQQGSDGWQPPDLPDEPAWALATERIQSMLRERRLESMWKEEGLMPRPCLLHRLDKDTSGVVTLARTERSRRYLSRQFHEHSILKRYLAVVRDGSPEWARPRVPFKAMRRLDERSEDLVNFPFAVSSPRVDEFILDGPLQRDPRDRRRRVVPPVWQRAVLIRI